MKIKEYLKEKGWTLFEFSKRVEIHRNTLRAVMEGREVRWSVIIKIVDFTRGKISYKDLRPQKKDEE